MKFIVVKGYIFTPLVSLSFEHHAGDSTILLGFTPILRENTLGCGQGPPTSLPPTSRKDLRLDGYLEYPHAAKAPYIYKHPCLLRDSKPDPTPPLSASLTTIICNNIYCLNTLVMTMVWFLCPTLCAKSLRHSPSR
ncbi:uncharacterized protein TNCV_1152721 [Trichonephila clavipes]|nr:uncharacterized protein TNCV_1152721 [Trichonephila clavipes]